VWWFASEVLVQLSPTEVRRPDVAGWRRERMPEAPADSPVSLVPDWVSEVVSPTNASNDTITKMRVYREAKVTHDRLIGPTVETLTVYRWHPDGYLPPTCRTGRPS
jgi:Uma2 family endonuclease